MCVKPSAAASALLSANWNQSVETALKLARAYHRRRGEPTRYKVISRRGSYHGATGGVIGLGGTARLNRRDYGPIADGYLYAPQPHLYRCEFGSRT